jgi:hypothetical protein
MSDDHGGKPRPPASPRSALSSDEVRAFTDRAPRCTVSVAVSCTPAQAGPGLEMELVNVSSSGMFVASTKLLEIGTAIAFEFKLDDGVVALRGSAEVVRRELRGMGLRFVNLDQTGEDLLARLIEATGASMEVASPEVEYGHGSVRVRLSPATARFFTYNPLLHIGVGGCFLPAEGAVPLGTGYELSVVDGADRLLLRCQAKVAATQERRIGLRFLGVEREVLQALRAEIARVSVKTPAKPPSTS